jgi:hypothetical protein
MGDVFGLIDALLNDDGNDGVWDNGNDTWDNNVSDDWNDGNDDAWYP